MEIKNMNLNDFGIGNNRPEPPFKVADEPVLSNWWVWVQEMKRKVTFLPGSWDKRFVHQLHERGPIKYSDNQKKQIARIYYKYRKQLKGMNNE